jgi:hypothetical protein
MIIGFFKSHQPLALFILPVIAVLFWLPAFFHPVLPDLDHAMPLYGLVSGWLAGSPALSSLISLMLVAGGALLLNYIVNEHEVLSRQSYLVGLLYIVLMSCAGQQLSFHPLLFANIFVMLAVHRLFSTYRRDAAFSEVFDSGFFIALAGLFYFPSVAIFPVIWVGLTVMRPFVWREWLISLFGLLVPFLFAAVFYFWNDRLPELLDKILYPVKNHYSQFHITRQSWVLLGITGWLFLIAAARLVTGIRVSKLKAKNFLLVLVWLSLFSAGSLLLAPSMSLIYYSFLAIPLAVFFANYFIVVKRGWWGELMFWLLLAAIVFNYLANTGS